MEVCEPLDCRELTIGGLGDSFTYVHGAFRVEWRYRAEQLPKSVKAFVVYCRLLCQAFLTNALSRVAVDPPLSIAADRVEEIAVDESDFEGTLVLEMLAAIGKLDEFFQAVDADDFAAAARLMKTSKVDSATIEIVLRKMAESDSEH